MKTKKIIFLCTHNSSRSQMAEGLLKNFVQKDEFEVYSAGTKPSGLNRFAVIALKEIGIDISGYRSKSIEEFSETEFSYIISVCDNADKECVFIKNKCENYINKSFKDPSAVLGTDEEKLDAFRKCRDEISTWIKKELLPDLVNGSP